MLKPQTFIFVNNIESNMYALDCEDDINEDDDMEYIDINDLPDDQQ